MKFRVLVVDDSAMMRSELSRILEQDPALEVVGTAINGKFALEKVVMLEPDVVTMDVNMPVMNGIEALKLMMLRPQPIPVIMISSLTTEGAEETMEALALGAFDYVAKPAGSMGNLPEQAARIREKVLAAARSKREGRTKNLVRPTPTAQKPIQARFKPVAGGMEGQIVGIGVSTGGPKTLMHILPELPANFPGCIVIAQHMPKSFTATFAARLNSVCAMTVKEAEEGDILERGTVYLAPGGGHMAVDNRNNKIRQIRLVENVPGEIYKPSVHVLFDSLNQGMGTRWIGVMLTGMGGDGADSLCALRKAGGHTIAEAEESCVVFGMPGRVVAQGGAEFVLRESEIAKKLIDLVGGE